MAGTGSRSSWESDLTPPDPENTGGGGWPLLREVVMQFNKGEIPEKWLAHSKELHKEFSCDFIIIVCPRHDFTGRG